MEKEINEFVVFCLEYYKERKGLTGKEMYDIFEEYKVFDYLEKGFDVLHTQGKEWIMEDIDVYLRNRGYNC